MGSDSSAIDGGAVAPIVRATTAESLTHLRYRADIDGLRAIAVLSVVGFHAFPDRIAGGFIGVDIFFVISGYLISTIILGGLERARFSFVEFYSRRIRRIFPALLLVLLACYAIGWNTLFTTEYRGLNKHILGGAGFISNLVLWSESGYFDTAAEVKPLLHLWSLGIEEQYYLLWPFILWLGWKLRLNLLVLTLSAAAGSFALNIATIGSDAVDTFYLPHTRVWELLIGSALAYFMLFHQESLERLKPSRANLLAMAGTALIGIGLLVITRERQFPGWWALLPTSGAALLIAAGTRTWLNRSILSHPILVWFGLISFPLYLWHWPLLTFARILEGGMPPQEVRLGAVILSIVLAWLTYQWVEKPVRTKGAGMAKAMLLFAAMVCVGALSYFSFLKERQEGLPRAFLSLNALDGSGFDGGDRGYTIRDCGIQDGTRKSLFGMCSRDRRQPASYALWGDSKAAAIYPGLVRTSLENGRWLFIGGNGNGGTAVPVLSATGVFKIYENLSSVALDELSRNADIRTVVLVTATRALFQLENIDSIEKLPQSPYYSAALDGLSNSVSRLLQAGKKVVLVVDNPTFPDPTRCLRRTTTSTFINAALEHNATPTCKIAIDRHTQLSLQYRRLLLEVQKLDPQRIMVFDTLKHLCNMETRSCSPEKNGRLLYSYTDHISDYAAGLIGADLNTRLANF